MDTLFSSYTNLGSKLPKNDATITRKKDDVTVKKELESLKSEGFLKLESTDQSWKVPIKVGKFSMQYSVYQKFQLRLEVSNFILSNFISNIPI